MTPKNDALDLANLIAPGAAPEEQGAGLADYLATLADSKWLILFIALLTSLYGAWQAFTQPAVYRAGALVQVEARTPPVGALREAYSMVEVYPALDAEVYTLRSREVAGRVVDALDLTLSAEPVYYPRIGEAVARRHQPKTDLAEPWFGLTQYAWGGEDISVQHLDVPSSYVGRPFTLKAGQPGHYTLLGPDGRVLLTGQVGQPVTADLGGQQNLTLQVGELRARPGTLFTVRRNSRQAAVESLRGSLQIQQDPNARGYSGMLTIALTWSDPVAAAAIVNQVADIYVKLSAERKSLQADRSLAFLEQQLPVIKEQMEAAEQALDNYRRQQGMLDLGRQNDQTLNRILSLEEQVFKLQLDRKELAEKYTANYPGIRELDGQLEFMNKELKAMYAKNFKTLPESNKTAERLAKDVAFTSSLYRAVVDSAQGLRIAKAGTVGNVRVLDYAAPNWSLVSKDRRQIVLTWLMIGLFVGVALAFLRRLLFSGGVEDPDVLERKLGLPVYATIVHSPRQRKLMKRLGKGKSALLAEHLPQDASIESLRSLRTTLHFALLESGGNSILITGPSPGVGKSFVTANLAAVLASSGKRVLVIDADLRKGLLHRYLGMNRKPGLTDYIDGAVAWEEAVRDTSIPGLNFLATGTIPPNPSELLMHERFAAVLEQGSETYDYVLIDSAPVLAVTDAAIAGRLADAVLMVIRSGGHPLRQIEHSVKRLQQAGVNLRGLMLNDVEVPKRGYGYGKYYRYKYRYRYAYKHGYQYNYYSK